MSCLPGRYFLAPPVQQGGGANTVHGCPLNCFSQALDAQHECLVHYPGALSHTMRQVSCRIADPDCHLGIPCARSSRSGAVQNARRHQRMSLSSKYDAGNCRKTQQITLHNLPLWMAIMNLYQVPIQVNCFFHALWVRARPFPRASQTRHGTCSRSLQYKFCPEKRLSPGPGGEAPSRPGPKESPGPAHPPRAAEAASVPASFWAS